MAFGEITPKTLRLFGIIAIIAAIIGAIGDVLLLYSPSGGYESGDYQFLQHISYERLVLGTFLGVLFIPFLGFGLWMVYELVKNTNRKLATIALFLGFYFAFIGVVVHGLFGIIGTAMKLHMVLPNQLLDFAASNFSQLTSFLNPLSAMVVILHIGVSLIFSRLILVENSPLPKWIAWANPLSIYIVLIVPYIFYPPIGNYIAPAAFNLSYAIFFFIITLQISNPTENS